MPKGTTKSKRDNTLHSAIQKPRVLSDKSNKPDSGQKQSGIKPEKRDDPDRGRTRTRNDGTKRSASQERKNRSSSLDGRGSKLEHRGRKRAREDDNYLASEDIIDVSVIGVYSREAFENYGKKWKKIRESNPAGLTTKKSRIEVDPNVVSERLSLLHTTHVSTGFQDQINALFKDRVIPHVIVVIEGKEEQSSLKIGSRVDDKDIELDYTKKPYVQGRNSLRSIDDKQSMNVYVRNDMELVYTITEEYVKKGNEKIKCIGLNYQTYDGKEYKKYMSLVVHIPNSFIGSPGKDEETHKAFEAYATKKKEEGIIVTNYLGDTNYQNAMSSNSGPSMGGILPDGKTLIAKGSPAKKDKIFIQSVSLGPGDSEYTILQPAALNIVHLTPDAQNRESTDHPSMNHFTAHKYDIARRNPDRAPGYYS